MYASIADAMIEIRRIIHGNLTATDSLTYSMGETDDAGPAGRGDLSKQNEPWYVIETVIDDKQKAGPGVFSPRRVWGGLDVTYLTKDRLDDIGSFSKMEQVGSWFEGRTINGIRFREFTPTTTNGRIFGFNSYAGTIALEFELNPIGA